MKTTHPEFIPYIGINASVERNVVSIVVLKNETISILHQFDQNIMALSIEWLNAETLIWSTEEGIFTINIYTRQVQLVLSSCDAQMYRYLNYSPEINKLICQKIDRIPHGGDLEIDAYLVMMNPDGTDEVRLEIP